MLYSTCIGLESIISKMVRRPGAVPKGPVTIIIKSIGYNWFYFICWGDMLFNPNLLCVTQNLIIRYLSQAGISIEECHNKADYYFKICAVILDQKKKNMMKKLHKIYILLTLITLRLFLKLSVRIKNILIKNHKINIKMIVSLIPSVILMNNCWNWSNSLCWWILCHQVLFLPTLDEAHRDFNSKKTN